MSVNNASNSKAPAGDAEIRQKRLINVQPLRPNELQPKYAQRIQHDLNDPDAHGWFAGLSKSNPNPHDIHSLTTIVHSMGACIGYCGAIPCCICYPNPFEPVEQGAVDLVSRLGRLGFPVCLPVSRTTNMISIASNDGSIPVWSK